ncbi:hypothetical protein COBT_004150, partial [Conglomerata obtusa]
YKEEIFCYKHLDPIKPEVSKISRDNILYGQIDWYTSHIELTKEFLGPEINTHESYLNQTMTDKIVKTTKSGNQKLKNTENVYTVKTNETNTESIEEILKKLEGSYQDSENY